MKTFDAEALGARIRRIRQEYGLQQKEMADSIGISLSYYGHIERGTRNPSMEILIRIANRLNVGTDMLLRDSLEKPCLPPKRWSDRDLGLFRQFLEENGEDPDSWFSRKDDEGSEAYPMAE